MKIIRIVLGILTIIPVALLANKISFHVTEYDEHTLRTLVYYTIGVPILIINMWAWIHPAIIEVFFGTEQE